MSKKATNNKYKHLQEEDRAFIAESLQMGMTFKDIGAKLLKDPTTISKEVKTNRVFKYPNSFIDVIPNLCVHRKYCKESYICAPEFRDRHCVNECRNCNDCNSQCRNFMKEICPALEKAPYVCNGCKKKTSCRLEKYYYKAVTAQRKYNQRLSDSRQGINISPEEWIALDNFITPLVKKGQPISHIYNFADDKIPCSKSTLYRYISSGTLSVKNIDLRRVVRYKRRKRKVAPRNNSSRKDRTYQNFIQFVEENPMLHIWEMDIVEGRKGGKVLMTLFSRETKLMLIFLLEEKTQEEVIYTLNYLEERIGAGNFSKTFHVILTDNGGEFLNANEIELSFIYSGNRTHLFYCDPYSSYQKGMLEKNHEFIRYVLPKGSSFDELTWYDVALLASHINAITRDSLDGLSPYRAMKTLNPSLLNNVDLMDTKPEEINLTPDLLR